MNPYLHHAADPRSAPGWTGSDRKSFEGYTCTLWQQIYTACTVAEMYDGMPTETSTHESC